MSLIKYMSFVSSLVLFLNVSSCFAQGQIGKYIEVNMGYGVFSPHKTEVKHLQKGPSFVGEVAYTLRTDNSECHHGSYNQPYYGILFGIADGGNRDEIGMEGYLSFFGGLPFYKSDNPLVLKSAIGLGYVQKPFDKFNNPKQNAIGSKFNINFHFRFEKNFQIKEGGGINLGIGLVHYSNGSYQRPNLGLNYFHVYLGKRFKIQECKAIPDSATVISILPYTPKKIELELNGGLIGYNELSSKISDKFLLVNASAHFNKQFSVVHGWSNGVDTYYNGALSNTEGKALQIGISSLYVMNFDDFKIGAGLGGYLLGKPEVSRGLYSLVFVQQYFNNRWFVKFTIKTHRTIADFFTFGIGYSL